MTTRTNPLFKVLTRPPIFLGVPMIILLSMVTGVFILFLMTSNLLIVSSILPIWAILAYLTHKDDYIFNILAMKFKFISKPKTNKVFGAKTYVAISPQKEKVAVMPKIFSRNIPVMNTFEEVLPYSSLIDDSIVFTKDYRLIATYKAKGSMWEAIDANTLQKNQNSIEETVKMLGDSNISFYIHSLRKKASEKLVSNYTSKYLTGFSKAYNKAFKENSLYRNEYYITLIYSPYSNTIDKKAFQSSPKEEYDEALNEQIKSFKEKLSVFEKNMEDYSLSILSSYKENNILYSKQLEFYEYLMSFKTQKVVAQDAPIFTYLTGGLQNIKIGNNTGLLESVDGEKKYFRILEIKTYPKRTKIGLLNALMYLDTEYTITQSFTPLHKTKAASIIKKQRSQLSQVDDDGLSEINEIPEILDEIVTGDTVLGEYYFSIMVLASSKEEIIKKTSEVISALSKIGIKPALSDLALTASYFSQYPANFNCRPRVTKITSKNFANFISLHNFPEGRKYGNCWGDTIMPLKTPSKQAYFLNLHKEVNLNDFGEHNLGNFLVFGESGGGKTAFLMLLLNMLLKYNEKSTFPKNIDDKYKKSSFIFLDKDKGGMGNILALGGKYIEIESGHSTGFNPFMCENTEENIVRLESLIKILVTSKDQPRLNSVEEANLNRSIRTIMRFKKEKRMRPISLLTQLLTEEANEKDSLKKRLTQWRHGKSYGGVFDNNEDTFDLTGDYSVFGIDGTNFLDDKEVKDPICYYILWKTLELADGRRFVLIGDEAHAWLENEIVADFIHNKLKTIRKDNGILGFATQEVDDIAETSIARTLISQSATTFFFSDTKGLEKSYVNHLRCSTEEFHAIRNFNPKTYNFLVKRANERIIVSADMSDMPKYYLKILSTSKVYVDAIRDIFDRDDISLNEKVDLLIKFYKGGKE